MALRANLGNIMTGVEKDNSLPDDCPVLFVKGEMSDYITEKDVALIKSLYPGAAIKTIGGTGHWVHAEKPAELFNTIYDFLKVNRLCN